MIAIDISYAEMSFLRELVEKEQQRIWREEWVSRLPKDTSIKDLEKLFTQTMVENVCDKPIDNRGCCAILLKKIQEKEEEIQTALRIK